MSRLKGKWIEDVAVSASKLGVDVADAGLTGGFGSPLSAQADTTGGANLARSINVSQNGIAVKVDDITVGENGSQQLYVKDNSIGPAQMIVSADYVFSGTVDTSNGVLLVATPTQDNHAANKSYVDSIAQGLDPKGSVRAATISAGTLATDFEQGDVIDGVSLSAGDRILLKDQASPVENGIYIVQATGAPVRSTDMAAGTSAAGAFTFIEEGTDNADTGWVCTSDHGADVVGTDPLTWTQFSEAGQITAGTGLTKSGSTIQIGDGTIGTLSGINRQADDIGISVSAGLEIMDNEHIGIETSGVRNYQLYGGISDDKLDTITTPNKVSGSAVEDVFLRNDQDDTMDGKLTVLSGMSVSGNTIEDVGYPINGTDAANKNYVDQQVSAVDTSAVEIYIEFHTLTVGDIAAKGFPMTYTPIFPTEIDLTVIGGIPQQYGLDFTTSAGSSVYWGSLGLDGLVEAGEVVRLTYGR